MRERILHTLVDSIESIYMRCALRLSPCSVATTEGNKCSDGGHIGTVMMEHEQCLNNNYRQNESVLRERERERG